MHLEHLLQARDVLLGLLQVRQKALLQLRIGRLICHFRERLGELLLGVINVLQLMHEQVIHGFDVLGEQSHRSIPHACGNTEAQACVQALTSLRSIADATLTGTTPGCSEKA
jgi:hypothetical protein